MSTLKMSDLIREFVRRNYIEPARKAGQQQVVVRAGDVHSQLKLVSEMPHVCSALGANKFATFAGVKLLDRDGPHQGANMRFTFEVLP